MSIYIFYILLEQSGSKMNLRYNNAMTIEQYVEESKKLPDVNQVVLTVPKGLTISEFLKKHAYQAIKYGVTMLR